MAHNGDKKMSSKKKTSKKCAALEFAADATNDAILAKCATEWKKRNKMADGTLNKNNYAPIYVVRGDEKMSVRRSGKNLVLFASVAEIPCPLPTLKW
jgi:hypothetical protein